jgi:hypothetical protein
LGRGGLSSPSDAHLYPTRERLDGDSPVVLWRGSLLAERESDVERRVHQLVALEHHLARVRGRGSGDDFRDRRIQRAFRYAGLHAVEELESLVRGGELATGRDTKRTIH